MTSPFRYAPPPWSPSRPGDEDDLAPVLVVDDHPPNLDAIDVVLTESGCRLVRAHSADEALLALLEQEFAVIVLDIKMPDMNGVELADLIKTRPRLRHVPILFLTAHMFTEQDILRAYGVGAVDYLTKPIHAEILRSKIGVFVDLFCKTRALARTNEALRREAVERQRAEEALRLANQELEARVRERTDALEQADRRKDQFLAVLGHELRNPLAPILSAVEVMQSPQTSPAQHTHVRGVVRRQVQQMTRLIDDLLDVGRITTDRLVLQFARVDVGGVIAAAIETSRPTIDERRHELTTDMPAEPLVLHADPARLSQVLSNMLTNAAKYTEPGGRIHVAVDAGPDGIAIRVRDTGVGIDPAMLPTIFELFGHVEHESGLGSGGLGIGLALARQLVEMHGGRLEARSEGPNRGSEFSVWLPPSIIVREAVDEPDDVALPGAPGPVRVLVVDDNQDGAEMLALMLEDWGYDVRQAYSAAGAYTLADTFHPQVALLDLGLNSGPDGYAVADHLRAQPWADGLVLIAVTGRGQQEDRERSLAAGFFAHLVKPVAPDLLRTMLAGLPISPASPTAT
jgi:signal transduction histidine kinase